MENMLKEMVMEISKNVKEALETANNTNQDLREHKIWEEGYHKEALAKDAGFRNEVMDFLRRIELQTTKTNGRVNNHEDRFDEWDVWRAGFIGHIKGIWLAISLLIPSMVWIIFKLMEVL